MLNLYDNKKYKALILLPILLLVASFFLVQDIPLGVELKGGTTISVSLPPGSSVDLEELKSKLEHTNLQDLSVRAVENPLDGSTGILVEFTDSEELLALEDASTEQIEDYLKQYNVPRNDTDANLLQLAKNNFHEQVKAVLLAELNIGEEQLSVREVGPSLGSMFWEQSLRALVIAFVLMAIVVFIAFRKIVPSTFVLLAIVFDILLALAAMSFFNIHLSLPTFAALLMLIGYAVDTNVMLTNKVLKRSVGTVSSRMNSALTTGVTMTGTTLVVLTVLVTTAHFMQVAVLFQIAIVLLFGLVADLIGTWMMNAVILKWWVERS